MTYLSPYYWSALCVHSCPDFRATNFSINLWIGQLQTGSQRNDWSGYNQGKELTMTRRLELKQAIELTNRSAPKTQRCTRRI